MTYPRRVVPGTTYLLTRRCTQRRFMLVPRSIVPQLFGGCVALAAERHGVLVHAVTVMSNHYHAVVTDQHGNIPEFCRDVHSLSARALNAHLGRWEALWSAQRLSLVELVDAPDVWDKLVYTLTNPVEAGLVSRSSEWPGLRTRASLNRGAPTAGDSTSCQGTPGTLSMPPLRRNTSSSRGPSTVPRAPMPRNSDARLL